MPPKHARDDEAESDSTYNLSDTASDIDSGTSITSSITNDSEKEPVDTVESIRWLFNQVKWIKGRLVELEDFQVDLQKTNDKHFDKVHESIDKIYGILADSFEDGDGGGDYEAGDDGDDDEDDDDDDIVCTRSKCYDKSSKSGVIVPATVIKIFGGGRNNIFDYLKTKLDAMVLSHIEYTDIQETITAYINAVGVKSVKNTDVDYLLTISNTEMHILLEL